MGRITSLPVHELTDADLRRHPVWQFVTEAEHEDGVDESHVFPTTSSLQLGTFGSFIAAATYSLKNGQELPGAVQVDLIGAKALFTPAFIYAQGKSVDPLASDVELRLARITKMPKAKPAKWRLQAPFAHESVPRGGRIASSASIRAFGLLVRLISLRFARRHQ